MTFLESLVLAFGVSGISVFIAFMLAKSLLSSLLEKDLENFRGQITAQNIEKQIVLSRLHEKRVDAIALIHEALLEYTAKCRDFLYKAEGLDESGHLELLESINTATKSFRSVFQEGRLYLHKSVCDKIEATFNQVQSPTLEFIYIQSAYTHSNRVSKERYEIHWTKAFESFADKLPLLVEELENEFRSLLGVESES